MEPAEMATALPRRRLSGIKTTSNGGSSSSLIIQQAELQLPNAPSPSREGQEQYPTSQQLVWRRIGALILATVGLLSIYALFGDTDFPTFSSSLRRGTHLPHHKRLAEAGISRYELLPEFRDSNEPIRRVLESTGERILNLELKVLDSSFHLELTKAEGLFAKGYKTLTVTPESRAIANGQVNCIYDASIKGDPESFGSVSLCNENIQVIMFHKHDGDRAFTVAPLDENVHVAYRHLIEVKEKRHLRPCPVADEIRDSSGRRLEKASKGFQITGKQNKTVRLAIVNDARRYATLGNNTETNTAAIVHAVNAFYKSLHSQNMYGIQFKLVSQLTFTDHDGWNTTELPSKEEVDSQQLLDDFYEWKRSISMIDFFPGTQPDLIQLYSGRKFDGGLVGRAAQAGVTEDGGVCGDRNVGVCQMADFDMGLYAKISAHELGHSLSLPHDSKYNNPECSKDTNTYMAASISIDQGTHFSRCSLETIKAFFAGGVSFPYKGCLERDDDD